MVDNIHKDHRKRIRKEFLEQGFNMNTPKHKILEMLLFYGIAQKDTNKIAHRLIENFGSIEGVLEADSDELQKIEGIGENCAALIKLSQYIAVRYYDEKNKFNKRFNNLNEICEMVTKKYLGVKNEKVAVTCLDKSGKFLGFDFIGEGDIESVGISVRRIIEIAFKRNATAVLISHNHPAGNALPSDVDITITENIAKSLKQLNIEFLDHIIIADNDFVSLRQSYQYGYIFVLDN